MDIIEPLSFYLLPWRSRLLLTILLPQRKSDPGLSCCIQSTRRKERDAEFAPPRTAAEKLLHTLDVVW